MTKEEFKKLKSPERLESAALKAMWFDLQDDWRQSHEIAQDIETTVGSHIHGYLHWKEGDLWNADYWYRNAGLTRPITSLEVERDVIIQKLLES